MPYLPRLVDSTVAELVAEVPAVLIAGPRASGKTTTAKQHAVSTLQLDRGDQAAAARADVDVALEAPEPLLIDEWQFVPEILAAVKRAVDTNGRAARFLLTGSAAADLGPAGWAMAGRVLKVNMWGITERELIGAVPKASIVDTLFGGDIASIGNPSEAPDLRGYVERALRGMLPQLAFGVSDRVRQRQLSAYIEQITLRDSVGLTDNRDPRLVRKYLAILAANTAGIPEQKTLFDGAGIDRQTAQRYDSLLEGLFLTDQLPAWSNNRLSRLTRSPKRHLVDPAFMGPLLGVDVRSVLRSADLMGRVIDSFVVAQLRPELEVCEQGITMSHLRQEGGAREVDLMLEAPDGRVVAVEVKAGSTPDGADAKHLVWLRDKLGDRFIGGVIFHTGAKVFKVDDLVHALPISTIWS
jgi:uncharacterized protein